jgi:hypothetical protein
MSIILKLCFHGSDWRQYALNTRTENTGTTLFNVELWYEFRFSSTLNTARNTDTILWFQLSS